MLQHKSTLYESLLSWLPAFLPPRAEGRWGEGQVWFWIGWVFRGALRAAPWCSNSRCPSAGASDGVPSACGRSRPKAAAGWGAPVPDSPRHPAGPRGPSAGSREVRGVPGHAPGGRQRQAAGAVGLARELTVAWLSAYSKASLWLTEKAAGALQTAAVRADVRLQFSALTSEVATKANGPRLPGARRRACSCGGLLPSEGAPVPGAKGI